MPGPQANNRVWWVCAYVFAVLLVDSLAANGVRWRLDLGALGLSLNWSIFTWRGSGALSQFDYFKLLFWLVIPVALCFWEMDWGYFGFARWKRADVYLLLGMAGIGLVSVLAILFIPQMREWYPSRANWSWNDKVFDLYRQALWNASWLPGWEFLHRYFLLRPLVERWPKWGWVVVPVSEALYHLQKDPIEMVAMFVAGVVFTLWAVARKNLMLPLLVHGAVEVGLAVFLVLV